MLKFISVEFTGIDSAPFRLSNFRLKQSRYEHDLVFLTFNEWDASFDAIKPGIPVSIKIKDYENSKDFYGYVHHIEPKKTPGSDNVTVAVIGASFVFKQANQAIYKNTTASDVVKKLAVSHNFSYAITPHPRVFPQVAQSGQSDWQLMVKLAKQCGYSLRADNTELYFQPLTENFTKYKYEAQKFYMNDSNNPKGSTIYSFMPIVGETLHYEDGSKSATAVTGIDLTTDNTSIFRVAKQKSETTLRTKVQENFFDRFQSGTTAVDFAGATYEAEAADVLTMFPYRAEVEVLGNVELKPTMPIYLEGIGSDYSGYWIILEAEHIVNNLVYTTKLTVGSDSLGAANTWKDGASLNIAPTPEIKTIFAGEVKSNSSPETVLKVIQSGDVPSSSYIVNSTKNRLQSGGSSTTITNWVSKGKKDLNATIQKDALPSIVYEKLRTAGVL